MCLTFKNYLFESWNWCMPGGSGQAKHASLMEISAWEASTWVHEPSAAAFPGAFTESWFGNRAAGTGASSPLKWWLCKELLNPVNHNGVNIPFNHWIMNMCVWTCIWIHASHVHKCVSHEKLWFPAVIEGSHPIACEQTGLEGGHDGGREPVEQRKVSLVINLEFVEEVSTNAHQSCILTCVILKCAHLGERLGRQVAIRLCDIVRAHCGNWDFKFKASLNSVIRAHFVMTYQLIFPEQYGITNLAELLGMWH